MRIPLPIRCRSSGSTFDRVPGVLFLLLLVPPLGCSGASLDVSLRDAHRGLPISNASVLLFDPVHGPCDGNASGGQRSSANGVAHVEARWCGKATLVVAARGYFPVTYVVGTCDTRRVALSLQRFPAESTYAIDSGVDTARAFLDAIGAQDEATLRRLLSDPRDASLYLGTSISSNDRPYTLRFVRVLDKPERVMEFAVYSDTGCQQSWFVQLRQHGDGWTVNTLTPAIDLVR
jgi:hypothetical protein